MSDNQSEQGRAAGTDPTRDDAAKTGQSHHRRRRRRRPSSPKPTTPEQGAQSSPDQTAQPQPSAETPQAAEESTEQKKQSSRRRRSRQNAKQPQSHPVVAPVGQTTAEAAAGVRRPQREEESTLRPDPRRSRNPSGAGRDQRSQHATVGTLRVIPLGGVGEVGKNMTVVEFDRDLILLDCGGKFPEEEQRGIELIIPDVSYVKERLQNLRGILITHGHEDHIGGLPYIIPQIKGRTPIPIYGPALALGFIENKLNEHHLMDFVDLRPVSAGERVRLGQLTAEFIHVTHSIPDTNAIAVHSPVGTIVDTADFKFDPTPVMGGPTDERRLQRLGQNGVLALFSDTVRVEVEGSTPSEKVVQETMDRLIKEAKGQVIIATFASNISRIHMALAAAEKYNRKVAVAGRSMEQNSRVAVQLGYLAPAEGMLIPLEEILRLPKERRVLVLTGSQGEAAAALSRIAAAEHPRIRVGHGDVVLVSATPVPGNEETVTRTIDNLFRRGATVIYSGKDKGVHVSGHAGRDELRKMIDLLKPKFTVPIHGEYRHMSLYRDLCVEAGIPFDHVLLPEIGGVIEFTKDTMRARGRVKGGAILVDRIGEQGRGPVALRDPEHLIDDGVVIVTIVVNRATGALIAGPEIVGQGLKGDLNDAALKAAAKELVLAMERSAKGSPQFGYLVQRSKEIVGRSLLRRSKSRPLILPVVLEL